MNVRSRFRLALVRDKLQVFFLGLLLGLVIGGGFFLLKLDHYVQQMGIYKTLTKSDDTNSIRDTENDQSTASAPEKKSIKRKSSPTDSTPDILGDTLADSDSDLIGSYNEGGPAGDEIVVRKDELIAQVGLSLRNLDTPAPVADSLARKEAGVRDEPPRIITVEYWKSPLNYKGYKLTRSRLVLFGLTQEDQVALYKFDNSIFLKSTTGVFRLEPSSDFRQMERITDEAVIGRLN